MFTFEKQGSAAVRKGEKQIKITEKKKFVKRLIIENSKIYAINIQFD